MKDIYGNELHVGDTVAYVANANSAPRMATGTITKIYTSNTKCSVDNHPNIFASRTLLLKSEEVPYKDNLLQQAIGNLCSYCDETPCSECKIKDAIKCSGNENATTAPPHRWQDSLYKKEGDTACS